MLRTKMMPVSRARRVCSQWLGALLMLQMKTTLVSRAQPSSGCRLLSVQRLMRKMTTTVSRVLRAFDSPSRDLRRHLQLTRLL